MPEMGWVRLRLISQHTTMCTIEISRLIMQWPKRLTSDKFELIFNNNLNT